MRKSRFLIATAVAALSCSQAAMADTGGDNWSISGWINQAVTYVDDGHSNDVVSVADNGTTLGSRITLAGSTELPNSGLTAGFEVILEPRNSSNLLGFGTGSTGSIHSFDNNNGDSIGVLGHNIHLSSNLGKLTFGLQSMPTDNIAVLEDPSLTLWSSISPVFRGNAVEIRREDGGTVERIQGLPTTVVNNVVVPGQAAANIAWGDFMGCYTAGLRGGAGIGIDCNGIYRQGVRYDLPEFGPFTVAVGAANDDVYDVAAKFKHEVAGLKTQFAIGYAINRQGDPGLETILGSLAQTVATAFSNQFAGTVGNIVINGVNTESENLQMQLGIMDTHTGLFGTFAYQREWAEMEYFANASGGSVGNVDFSDTVDLPDTDAYWLKVGIKRAFNSLGDTSLAFQYGSYNDQYITVASKLITDSEVQRIGVEVNQYFGSRLIVYGVWEQLSLDVEGIDPGPVNALNGAEDLNMFTAGLTFFF